MSRLRAESEVNFERALRILYVDTEEFWRGGQEQLVTLMTGMKQRGHEVHLAAPHGSPLAQEALRRSIPAHPFRQRGEFSPLAPLSLLRMLRRRTPDIVHFNTPRPIIAGGLASFLGKAPLRVCSRRVNFPLRSKISYLKYNLFLEGIVTVSTSIQQTLIQHGVDSDRIKVIYEGVDVSWIDQIGASSLFSDGAGPIVGTVAHLSPEKGHGTVLKAAALLRSEFPEVTYVFVGDGPLKAELAAKAAGLGIRDRVVFTGFRSDSEALMKEFDIFCLASDSEGLSSAILAAMATPLPVVATNVGGIPELVIDGETGFLSPAGDPESLAARLRPLLLSEELRSKVRQAGRQRVERYFTLEKKLDETERLYLGLRGASPVV